MCDIWLVLNYKWDELSHALNKKVKSINFLYFVCFIYVLWTVDTRDLLINFFNVHFLI